MIHCCKCGSLTPPNILNMCTFCSTTQTNLSLTIKKHNSIKHCRKCDRYLSPPKAWLSFSNQNDFISFLLKMNSSLKSLNITKADLSVHPNSKILNLLINIINSNYLNSAVVNENTLEITYKLIYTQCRDCAKMEDKQYWQSIIQVRQKNKYKRTFNQLEEMIHKSNLSLGNIIQCKNGLDFQFSNLNDANKLINFIKSNIVCRVDLSNKLISQDRKSNLNFFKNTFSVKLCPINKNDLVEISKELANIYKVNTKLIVLKISTEITLMDPILCKKIRINNITFWKNFDKINILCTKSNLKEFDVFEKMMEKSTFFTKYRQCDLFLNNGNETIHSKSHLGNIINEGDVALGYDLNTVNLEIDSDFSIFIIKKKKFKGEKKINLDKLMI